MGIRVTSTLKPRTATYVVAASDAPAHVKAQADYVCSGIADDVLIREALDALSAGGGKIQLTEGTYNLSNSMWNQDKDYVTIRGTGDSTVFKPTTVVESTLTVAANPADPSITVANGAIFKENQQIMICTKDYTTNDKEPRRITDIIGNVLTLDSALALAHVNGSAVYTAFRCLEAKGRTGLIFENFSIDGNKANQYYYSQALAVCNPAGGGGVIIFEVQNGVHLDTCTDSRVENVHTKNIAGWGGVAINHGSKNIVTACIARGGVNHGFLMFDELLSEFSNNFAESNGSATTTLGHNFLVEETSISTIVGNRSQYAYVDGYYIWETAVGLVVTGNVSYHDPIGFNVAADNSIFTGNFADSYGPNPAGFKCGGEGNVITGNSIRLWNTTTDATGLGILLNGGAIDTIISNNKVEVLNNHVEHGIVLVNALKNILVQGNILKGNFNYGCIAVGTGSVGASGSNVAIKDNIIEAVGAPTFGIMIRRSPFTTSIISGNRIEGVTTPIYFYTNDCKAGWKVEKNLGYLAPGEVREYKDSLAKVAQNGAVIAWQNPEAQAGLVSSTARITTGGGAVATGPMGLTTSVVVEDCEDAWNESTTHCTSTLDTSDFERGAGSAKLVGSGVVADDILATEARAAQDLSAYTHLAFKIKSSAATAAADLRMLISENVNCGAPAETLDVPALVADVWTLVVVPFINAGATRDNIISIGLQYHANVANTTIRVDDVRAVTIGATMFAGAGVTLNTTGVYDSMNITDAGAGLGKPIYIDAKNGTNDILVMVATGGAAASIVGSYYIKLVGV